MKNNEKSTKTTTHTPSTSNKNNTSTKGENKSQDTGKREVVPNIEADRTKSKVQDSTSEKLISKK